VVSGERTEGGAAKIAALFCALKFTSPLLTLLSESREQTGVYYPALMPPELLYFFSGPAYSHNAFISRTAKITENQPAPIYWRTLLSSKMTERNEK
jgi:hypothetical protein